MVALDSKTALSLLLLASGHIDLRNAASFEGNLHE